MDEGPVEIFEPVGPLRGSYEVGLVIMTRNRAGYLARFLESLSRSNLLDTCVAIVDDASDEAAAVDLVRNAKLPGVPVARVMIGAHRDFQLHQNLRILALRDGR